jgi:hypothetical protein
MTQLRHSAALENNVMGCYSAELVEPTRTNGLTEIAYRIDRHCPPLLEPRAFVASLQSGWSPRTVLVREGGRPVGLVYTREKLFARWHGGIVYGDATLGNLVLANTANREGVLRAAVQRLLDGRVYALRFLVPPQGYEEQIIRETAKSGQWRLSQKAEVLNHARLLLPSSYEEFLTSTGYRTRRNFRYYRRRAEADGHQYFDHISSAELREAAGSLRTKCTIKSSRSALERICRWVESVNRPFVCGLRSSQGAWLSISAGFYTGTSAVMLLQLNDDLGFDRNSLSLVLRGYLIESLIQAGVQELIFWAGVGGALARYVDPVYGTGIHVDSPALAWKLVRTSAKCLSRVFPKRVRRDLEWITPIRDAGGV